MPTYPGRRRSWEGEYGGVQATWLRWASAEGDFLPTGAEIAGRELQRAEQEMRRAEEERRRAEEALRRAEQAEKRIAELEARLARLEAQNRAPDDTD